VRLQRASALCPRRGSARISGVRCHPAGSNQGPREPRLLDQAFDPRRETRRSGRAARRGRRARSRRRGRRMRRVRSPERVEERRGGFGRWIGPDQEHSIDTLEPGPVCVRSCQVTRRPTTRALTAPVSATCQSTRPHLGQAPVVLSQQPGPVDRFVRVSASPDSHGTVKILLVSGSLRTAVLAPATRACPSPGRCRRTLISLLRYPALAAARQAVTKSATSARSSPARQAIASVAGARPATGRAVTPWRL